MIYDDQKIRKYYEKVVDYHYYHSSWETNKTEIYIVKTKVK